MSVVNVISNISYIGWMNSTFILPTGLDKAATQVKLMGNTIVLTLSNSWVISISANTVSTIQFGLDAAHPLIFNAITDATGFIGATSKYGTNPGVTLISGVNSTVITAQNIIDENLATQLAIDNAAIANPAAHAHELAAVAAATVGLHTQAEIDSAVATAVAPLHTQAELDAVNYDKAVALNLISTTMTSAFTLKEAADIKQATMLATDGLYDQPAVDNLVLRAVSTAVNGLQNQDQVNFSVNTAVALAVASLPTQAAFDSAIADKNAAVSTLATVTADKNAAIADKNAGLAGVVSNLAGVDISSSSGSVTFLKTKTDYTAFDTDKKIIGNALESVLKVHKSAFKPSEHQIYHGNMNKSRA